MSRGSGSGRCGACASRRRTGRARVAALKLEATVREHGGDLDAAVVRHGGRPDAWVDLSTGINRVPYPLPAFPPRALTDLPPQAELAACAEAARRAYRAAEGVACLPLAG